MCPLKCDCAPQEPTPPPPPREPSPEVAPPPPSELPAPMSREPSPTSHLPPRIGINGFNGTGRLVLRAAIEKGLDVRAVNDPFVPAKYMVYMLKFDLARAGEVSADSQSRKSKRKVQEIHTVRESPTGDLIVNGRGVAVFAETDVTRIPWSVAGVNYVVEATDVLNTVAEVKLVVL